MSPVSGSGTSSKATSKTTPQLCWCQDQSVAPDERACPTNVSLQVSAQPDAELDPSNTSIEYQTLTMMSLPRRLLRGKGGTEPAPAVLRRSDPRPGREPAARPRSGWP